MHRVTAAFTGAHKQKNAISELGPRTCTVKLLRSSVMLLVLSAWVKSEERGMKQQGVGEDYEGLVDARTREHVATVNTCLSNPTTKF